MTTFEITKTAFEGYVPAFRSATDEIFEAMQSFITDEASKWQNDISEEAEIADTVVDKIMRAICLRAAYEAVPQLDLVLTPTGFGIVSNQNTAPASRERVDALREQLRKSASIEEDYCRAYLLRNGWYTQTDLRVTSLFWSPTLVRRYGIKYEGAEVYAEEFEKIRNDIFLAELKLQTLISPELYTKLIELQRDGEQCDALHYRISEMCSHIVAATLSVSPLAERTRKEYTHLLINMIEKNETQLPEYADSATAAARHAERYENKKEDPTYIFH